ncbi:TetR/AcrR family transcriptional regulator [Rhodococcus chondri]|uniref:TetR/AcrR family transcriptional regulator n=1 Tax=Rhodococcus chondri TaxID=3065941 RepID=A0ABU7JP77_9NOCA|nr:TetR/AcrR family transcriptional regulator [Rhodococcus sp. CC-R104]MEE2031831.1 TetR/AcrR family transcriptional regulator [Rhodococcus sp. CC-R104]
MSTDTRDRILTAMGELMRRQGYSATGVKQVCDLAHARMGSLYHYFPHGKQQVAAESLRASGEAYIQLLPLLMDPYDDLGDAVSAFFEAGAQQIEDSGWINMCPVGTVAGEIADSEPELRAAAADIMGSWVAAGTTYFEARGLGNADARELILAILGALEGAFVLCRTLRTSEPMRAAGRSMTAHLETLRSGKKYAS